MTLHEIRVSEIRPGDEWLLEGAWVLVTAVDMGHPDDRVGIGYVIDSEPGWDRQYRGFEVAVVKRGGNPPLRGEVVQQLASYRIAIDYGDPVITRDVTDEMAFLLMALANVTEAEVDAAVFTESPSSE